MDGESARTRVGLSRLSWLVLAALVAPLATGCAMDIATSVRCTDTTRVWEGVPYSLPRSSLVFTATFDPPSLALAAESIADPSEQFILVHNKNFLYSDDLDISVSEGSLLSSVTAQSTDETAALLSDLGELATTLVKAKIAADGGVVPGTMKVVPGTVPSRLVAFLKERFTKDCKAIKGERKALGLLRPSGEGHGRFEVSGAHFAQDASRFLIRGTVESLRDAAQDRVDDEAREFQSDYSEPRGKLEYAGVLTRAKASCLVKARLTWDPEGVKAEAIAHLKDEAAGGNLGADALETAWQDVVASMERNGAFDVGQFVGIKALHDAAPVAVIPLSRVVFVKAKTTVTLVHGVLTQVHFERPSPFAAAITSPIDAAKKVVSVLTEVVQIKHNSEAAEEAAARKEKEDDAAAKEAKLRDRTAKAKAYLAARNLVEQKKAAYANETWTPAREQERLAAAGAIIQAMYDANEKALLAGQPVPYSDGDMAPYLK